MEAARVVSDKTCTKKLPESFTNTFPLNTADNMKRHGPLGPTGNGVWAYGVLGKLISDANGGMPVAFFNAAAGESSVTEWKQGLARNAECLTRRLRLRRIFKLLVFASQFSQKQNDGKNHLFHKLRDSQHIKFGAVFSKQIGRIECARAAIAVLAR